MHRFTRRQFIKASLVATASLAVPKMAWSALPTKRLSLFNIHTSEKLSLAYVEDGNYVPSALAELNNFMRDYRTGDVHPIDIKLLNQLHLLQHLTESSGTYNVISGYRSTHTNQALRANSAGVAKHSLHMKGCAVDIFMPGKDLNSLHQAALAMQVGGVGYYPGSNFIHLDTGQIRHWDQT